MSEPQDRSVPRSRVRAGDETIDRRGRVRGAPAILSYSFRPFFLAGAAYAALTVPLWLWMFASGAAPKGPFAGPAWHAHEMIFGYLAAIVAGYVLTTVPNWTGHLPLSGGRLAALVALWFAGRIAVATVSAPLPALAVDVAFLAVLAAAVWREVVAGRNWGNAPVATLLTVFAGANLLHHLGGFWPAAGDFGIRLSLGAAGLMIALIGGRIVPSFTRNWLVRTRRSPLPASFGRLDRAALALTAAAAVAWVAVPGHAVTGVLLLVAGVLLAVRLARWRGMRTWREPIVFMLHLGYLWLAAGFLLLGGSVLAPALVPESAALHALTAGAIATMTLAVMVRATRAHTGNPIETDAVTLAVYAFVSIGALLRVAAAFFPAAYMPLLTAGGASWSLAFALFAVGYGPMLMRPRRGR
ncbi:MAG TPA: NnrS family protein [Amaricoccus sp.]|nr:NnrS family protein [Amaricoccus sp.]